ncbi:HlyD family secretion protein [Sphingobium mellinum]|uniref:HlyD family secretion protein n=1 Tax=Sphingobium mellinum TaxID=1387166 RepID=UPI0030ED7835
MSHSPLFRQEALAHRAERLHGNVNIATPMSWQVIGFLLFAALITVIAFLATATYARVETVPGQVALDRGVATIVPSRAGIVVGIDVTEGQQVAAGQRLAVIRSEENMATGATAPQRIREALATQDARLMEQAELVLGAAHADQARLKAQIEGGLAALLSLKAQIVDQQQLIGAAMTDQSRMRQLAKRGYVSKRDMERQEAELLTRRQQLAQMEQSLSSKRSEIEQARRAITQSDMAARAQVASTQSDRATLLQQDAQSDLARGYALVAPVGGMVTALTARLGQPASLEQQLMLLVPSHSQTRVELYVPTTASGFMAVGQDVRLSIDAFPYQTFGTVHARITSISRAAIPRLAPSGTLPVYLVTASLSHPWVMAFGHRQPLLPGMTLSARIVTERRSLIEWLFEPLFAVRAR